MKMLRIAVCVALAAPASAFFRKIGGIDQRIKNLARRIGRPPAARVDMSRREYCGPSLRAAR